MTDLRFQKLAAGAAADAAHLEHVAEIGIEFELQGNPVLVRPEIAQRDALVERTLEDQPLTLDMDDALRQRLPAERRQGPVGQVRGKQRVVLAQRGAEQGRPLGPDRQAPHGEDARVVAEHAVAFAGDIAVGIGDDECVGVLQRKQPQRNTRLAARRCGAAARGGAGSLIVERRSFGRLIHVQTVCLIVGG